jgi:hypothetical protein
MRPAIALFLVLALPAVASAADSASTPPHSAALLLRWRPGVWQPPAVLNPASGLRLEPETGEVAQGRPVATDAAALARAAAEASVRIAPDGSRRAVLGRSMARFTVVQVGADGKLEHECVAGEAEATRRVKEGR